MSLTDNPRMLDDSNSSVRPTETAQLRVGIVGAGKMAANHARAVARCAVPAQVIALADPSERALDALGTIVPSAKRFASLTELLSAAEVDVIHICTPPASHEALAVEALDAGRHVYVEKPFASSFAAAERILGIADARGLKVSAGHQLLCETPTRVATDLLPNLGRLTHIESYFSFRTVRRAPGGRVPLSSDLQLLDIFPHPLYLLLHFLDLGCPGTPELIALDVGEAGTVHALVRQGHLTATLVVTLEGRPVESYIRLVGTNGSLFADYIRGTVQRQIGAGTSGIDKVLAPYRVASQLLRGTTSALASRAANRQRSYPGLVELLDSFYLAVTTGSASPVSHKNILETTRIWERLATELKLRKRKQPRVALRGSGRGILVTGGTGLLGKSIVRQLIANGRTVRAVARREPAPWEQVEGADYIVADLAQPIGADLFEDIGAIIHTAAETAGGWDEHERNSVSATENVLRAAAAAGVTRFIHVSSLAVLAKPASGSLVTDETPLESRSRAYGPYVWGKLESERVAVQLGRELKIGVKVARPGPLSDASNFEPPGRLGRRIGNFFVAVGAPWQAIPTTDVMFAARTLIWMADYFDAAPDTVNLLDPRLPSKRDIIAHLRQMNPDVTVVWLPMSVLLPLSWGALAVQKLLRPKKPAIDVAKAFSSPRYDTSRISAIADRMDAGGAAGARASGSASNINQGGRKSGLD
jgi:predicted dehydrogenase/nucleoside-diphosphate-sugar epimerase